MIALDTNVLVRILVGDDAKQTAGARALVERLDREGETAFVSDIVMCELVWVLDVSYSVERAAIASALRGILHAKQLSFSARDQLARALTAYEEGRGDFADYLIREQAVAAGCAEVRTFDRKLLREAGFAAP